LYEAFCVFGVIVASIYDRARAAVLLGSRTRPLHGGLEVRHRLHPQFLASQAGAHILEEGGNAIDAAIAANAVMGVVQPYVNGIGGDLFMIYYEAKTGKLYGLNSSGWTPKALTIDYLKSKGVTRSTPSASRPSTCPARSPDGMQCVPASARCPSASCSPRPFTTRRTDSRSPNATHATGSPRSSRPTRLQGNLRHLAGAPKPGDLFKNPGLANSLRQIAEHGRDAYYNGPMTETMVKFLNAQGGTHTLEDFRDFQPEWVDPVSTTYRGWTVYELPPNGQGIAALSMLNIMEHFPMAQYGHNSVDALHVMIEAKKLAYADMYKYVGDPRFTPVPVKELISKDLAEQRAKLIEMDKAACQVVPSEISAELNKHGNSTIYLSTIDKDGNIVSLIQSNYAGYGTGMVAPDLAFPSIIEAPDFSSLPACRIPCRTQASAPHHHSGLHGEGRHPHRLRHHGRLEPGAGTRAVRRQHRRLRHERAGCAGTAPLHQRHL
jgi:gamma-glutamyltranspeptidase/glutathione hydrolase